MRRGQAQGFTIAEVLVALLFVSIALFGYIALQIRLIDSNEKLVAKQGALGQAEVQLAQSVTSFRRATEKGQPRLHPTVAEGTWHDRTGEHRYEVDTLTTRVRSGW